MAQFNELTPEEQVILLHNVDALMRPSAGELARVLNHFQAFDSDYDGQTAAIVAQLDTGAEIPNQSGLAGTATLDKEDVVQMATQIQAILTAYNTSTHREFYVKLSGAENTIG